MYVIVATQSMKKWMDINLSKFLIPATSKLIDRQYYCKTVEGDDFSLKLFHSNTVVIDGSLKKRLYSSLISNAIDIDEIGCDEVGVGDFFGPVVYVAVELNSENINKLSKLYINIKDSKKLTDPEIMLTYGQIKDIIKHNVQVVYDKDIQNNLNSIEQKMFYHFENIKNEDKKIIIDLFTTINAFTKYQKSLNLPNINNLVLETKADSKFISVALASIIARAIFLMEMDKMSNHYNFEFPKGSSNKEMDNIIDEFIRRNSVDELKKIAKTSFSTFKRAEDRWK